LGRHAGHPWATYVLNTAQDQANLLASLDGDAVTDIGNDAAADDLDEDTANNNDSQFMLSQDALGLTLATGVLSADTARAQKLDAAQIAQAVTLAGATDTDEVAVVAANQTLQDAIATQNKLLLDDTNQALATYSNDTNAAGENYGNGLLSYTDYQSTLASAIQALENGQGTIRANRSG